MIEELYTRYGKAAETAFGSVYSDCRLTTNYEISKGLGVIFNTAKVDRDTLEAVLSKPWATDGLSFSERIWNSKEKLIKELHKELTIDIIQGRDPQKAIDALAKKMKTSKYSAGRLVMTEEAYFASLAQKDELEYLGVEKYEILATLDDRTSDICQNLDGKIFLTKDYEPGTTAPPFHVYCRSTTVPHFDENFGDIGERAARDTDGKTYYVPDDMTYPEWHEKFVTNGDKSDLKSLDISEKSGIIKTGSDSMALENQRYGRNKDTLVNKTYIESGEYRRKFDNATDNPMVNKTLYDCAKTALKHRSGTALEDMYWIDSDTGEIVAKEINSTIEREVVYSAKTAKVVNAFSKNKLIALHTHPSSMPPSVADFNSCYKHGYKCGFIACHDGKILGYTSKGEIREGVYNLYMNEFVLNGKSEYDAQILALGEFQKSELIKFWEVI